MSGMPNRVSPIVAIAAVAVTLFSAVGIGVMTGIIPSSFSKNSESQMTEKADAPKAETASAPEKKAASVAHRKAPASEPARRTASASEPARVASAPQSCANCGRVEAVHAIEQKGEGSGLGAIAGGVVGGILGNQIGGGTGRTVATVAGAGAGALAGNEIEKRAKKTVRYDVVVRLEDGTSRTIAYETEPAFRVGDKVKIVNGTIVAN